MLAREKEGLRLRWGVALGLGSPGFSAVLPGRGLCSWGPSKGGKGRKGCPHPSAS